MYTVNAEKREKTTKAKKIRKNGMIPCSISDGKKNETILIQISEGEARKLLKNKGKGGRVLLNCGSDSYETILKYIEIIQLNNQIENMVFQLLNEEEYISSFASIRLTNEDKIQAMIYQVVKEIPYKALPQDLVEEVEIDLTTIRQGSSLMLKDLPIAKNEKLQFLLKQDNVIVGIS